MRTITDTITDSAGTVWEIIEALSDDDAQQAIAWARVRGSVGTKTTVVTDGVEQTLAEVRKVQKTEGAK
jgi:hypothetical protein